MCFSSTSAMATRIAGRGMGRRRADSTPANPSTGKNRWCFPQQSLRHLRNGTGPHFDLNLAVRGAVDGSHDVSTRSGRTHDRLLTGSTVSVVDVRLQEMAVVGVEVVGPAKIVVRVAPDHAKVGIGLDP